MHTEEGRGDDNAREPLWIGQRLAKNDETPLRMADQKKRQVGSVLTDEASGGLEIGQKLVEVAYMDARTGALPVAPVVVRPAVETGVGEVIEDVQVAARVFGETVNDEQYRTGVPLGGVTPPEEAVAVAACDPAFFFLQVLSSRRSARTRSTAPRQPW